MDRDFYPKSPQNTNLIPKRILNFRDAVDTFNCNKSIPLGNSTNPQDYDSYKLTIKIDLKQDIFRIRRKSHNLHRYRPSLY